MVPPDEDSDDSVAVDPNDDVDDPTRATPGPGPEECWETPHEVGVNIRNEIAKSMLIKQVHENRAASL